MSDWRSMRFGRAATSYHEATPVQLRMAGRILELLPEDLEAGRILELGCGTGHLTRLLRRRFPGADLLASDLSSAMISTSRALWPDELRPPEWKVLDARDPATEIQPDLVASNAVVQWFPDLESHFKAIRNLSPRGTCYAFSDFATDHFPELDRILRSDEFGYPPGPGHAWREAAESARRAGWKIERFHEEQLEERHPTAMDFLRHLKASGANRQPPGDKPLTRAKLSRLQRRLEAESPWDGGIRVTWKPWFMVLRAA